MLLDGKAGGSSTAGLEVTFDDKTSGSPLSLLSLSEELESVSTRG